MVTEMVPETSLIFNQLTRLTDREDFIRFQFLEIIRCTIYIYIYIYTQVKSWAFMIAVMNPQDLVGFHVPTAVSVERTAFYT
jgi:hypothetical protein